MQVNKDIRASSIEVDGASIHYKTVGAGPLLIPIPGANGAGYMYEPLAAALSHRFKVVIYDRRGYGNSHIIGRREPITMAYLRMQASDAASLIQHLSPGKPATVFATSGSATMGLELLQSRPDLVQQLVIHESLILSPLSASYQSYIRNKFANLIQMYGGTDNATLRRSLITLIQGKRDLRRLSQTRQYARLQSQPRDEIELFYLHELPQILDYNLDIEELRLYRDKLVFLTGVDKTLDLASSLRVLSKALGLPAVVVPGGHTGYVTDAEEFADKLVAALGYDKAKL
ncbi:hypothetical protein BBP40_009028 [Aspergillus hancockii]|nr:hypothetical protein BBP40_009028 [Aspergillus hancockii]